MSQKEANKVNKVFRSIVFVVSFVIAIIAVEGNTGHLFTACLVFAFGCNLEVAKADEFDLRD